MSSSTHIAKIISLRKPQWLNDSGQRTGRGALWTTAGLRAALMAPRMAGYIKKNRQSDQIIGYLPGEPVIDPVDWQELLKQIEGNRGRPPKGKCLCSGIVRCAACGGKLICQANKRDKSRRTYICRYKPDGQSLNPCGKTIASEESLDTVVSDWFLMRCTESGETAEALRRGARRRNEARRPHENEVRRLESLRDYWDKKLLDGGCSIERHKAMIQELESRLKDEYAELDKIGDAPTPGELEVQEIAAKWVEAKGDVTQRRRLLETVLSAGRGTVLLVHPGSALDTPDEVRARFEVAVNGSDDDDD